METYQAGLAGFLFSVLAFYLISVFWGGKPTNIKQFFHDKNVSLNVFSLAAGNLALGQGIVFVLLGTQNFGVVYLLLPGMLFLGQFVVYPKLISRVGEDLYARGTVLSGLSDKLDAAASKPVHFQWFTTSYVILTYLFCLCYEILVSTNLLALVMFPNPTLTGKIVIAFMLLAFTLSYAVTGGYRTVQRTDLMQVLFALVLIVGILTFLVTNVPASPPVSTSALIPTSAPVWVAFLTMFLTPFTAQIYGILNHSFASHQDNIGDRKKLFHAAGLLVFVVYIVLAGAALYYNHNKGDAKAALETWLSTSVKGSGMANSWLVAIAAIGLGAMIMSTVDTMMIAITQSGFEVFKGNSKSEDPTNQQLKIIRMAMLGIFVPVFVVMAWWWYAALDAFSLVFAVASPCEALAPMIVCLIFLTKRGDVSPILRPVIGKIRYLDVFYALLFLTLVGAFIALHTHWQWSKGVGFFAFVISSLLAWVVLRQPNLTAPTIFQGFSNGVTDS